MQNLETLLQCPICMEDFEAQNKPCILPSCGHSVCSNCVSELCSCPICRQSISADLQNSVVNVLASSLIEILKCQTTSADDVSLLSKLEALHSKRKEDYDAVKGELDGKEQDQDPICMNCDENVAQVTCDSCSILCLSCDASIHSNAVLRRHTRKPRVLAIDKYCSEHHQERLKVYCNTCAKLVCRDCCDRLMSGQHADHHLRSAIEVMAEQKQSYISSIETLKSMLPLFFKTMQKCEAESMSTFKAFLTTKRLVTASVEQFCVQIESMKCKLIETDLKASELLKKLNETDDFVEFFSLMESQCEELIKIDLLSELKEIDSSLDGKIQMYKAQIPQYVSPLKPMRYGSGVKELSVEVVEDSCHNDAYRFQNALSNGDNCWRSPRILEQQTQCVILLRLTERSDISSVIFKSGNYSPKRIAIFGGNDSSVFELIQTVSLKNIKSRQRFSLEAKGVLFLQLVFVSSYGKYHTLSRFTVEGVPSE